MKLRYRWMTYIIRMMCIILMLFAATQAFSLTLKIGTLAPSDTPWDAALRRLAASWKDISGGKVELKIYGGGIAGDEADMLRKMRIGQLDGAALSGTGLNRVSQELLTFSLPMFFESYEEIEYVMKNSTEQFRTIVEQKDIILVAWSTAGWVRFFGKRPIRTADDLRTQRISVSAEDEEILQTWRTMGFDAIPLHTTELMAGLQSGMVEAYHTPALIAAVYQWFALTPYMSSLNIAPLIVGLVMGERSWRKIPEEYREPFMEAAFDVLEPLYREVEVLEQEAMDVMLGFGLTVNDPDEEAMAEWLELVEKAYDSLIGTSISPEVFESVKKLRDGYREANENN
jgi:TRAP-type transport system periplasmic protein